MAGVNRKTTEHIGTSLHYYYDNDAVVVMYKSLTIMRLQLQLVMSGKKANPYRESTVTLKLDVGDHDPDYVSIHKAINALWEVLPTDLAALGQFVYGYRLYDTWEEATEDEYKNLMYKWTILTTV